MASISAVSDVDDINSADLQSANAGNVKKINHRVYCILTWWACAQSVPDYQLRAWNLPSLMASVTAVSDVDDMNGAYLQKANAGDVKNQ